MTAAAYPTRLALSGCCAAASSRMLMTSLENGFYPQAQLSVARKRRFLKGLLTHCQ